MDRYAYYKETFGQLPMPFAFVDLDRLDHNARGIAQAAGGKKIRIASKSLRCVDVMRRLLDADPVFQGIMCFTAAEAAFLAGHGFDDLLLGYPQWHRQHIAELAEWIDEGRTVAFMVDSVEHCEQLERLAKERGTVFAVCIDIDMSVQYPGLRFGVWRSPIQVWEQLKPVVDRIVQSDWLKLDGLMGYEAQVAGVGDRMPASAIKNKLVRALKKRSIAEAARRRGDAAERIAAMNVPLRFINAGGTGSLDSSRNEPWVTEMTAGSGFYSPALFDYYSNFQYEPAAGFAVEIVRKPRQNIVTCMGGGYTSSGSAGPEKLPKPYLPEGLKLFGREGAGEVQTPLLCGDGVEFAIGDPVFFRHAKAGELSERFLTLHAVSQGKIVGEYATYRGMGECFL
ncbi:amino acid deaminase/aldolase [Paenibacillus radicis (ex Gao et al. 2016)]|uniref:Amino acid aldolase n=1 Tax=Paenibacillus radicis (ex Gao et al. 2016) TaxID=1737354 RepID=A0A917M3I7_9BACL|nr:amino acid deaminase/aldolase [Paenibacillus radicis (ex Gao et al. 2016)]GGG72896.1 amino acid aldolase [Paenibacillus radicis (ex Gao et al. 2016)]